MYFVASYYFKSHNLAAACFAAKEQLLLAAGNWFLLLAAVNWFLLLAAASCFLLFAAASCLHFFPLKNLQTKKS